jgi:hypothetical protein
VLPRAVLGELEELSLFLDRSSSLEPEPALLDVVEKTMSPTRLARLGLWDCKLDDGGLERLARAPAFRALERLTLGYEKTWSHWRRGALSRARIPETSRARLLRWRLPDVPARPSDFRPQALARGPRRERLERLEMFFGELTQHSALPFAPLRKPPQSPSPQLRFGLGRRRARALRPIRRAFRARHSPRLRHGRLGIRTAPARNLVGAELATPITARLLY